MLASLQDNIQVMKQTINMFLMIELGLPTVLNLSTASVIVAPSEEWVWSCVFLGIATVVTLSAVSTPLISERYKSSSNSRITCF